jgi:glycosyltransferase involved in cell wall biosynthesis
MIKDTKLKTLIIIPLFNEEENIELILNDLNTIIPSCDILFIDDKSTDKTLQKIKNTTNFPVLQLSINLGIGGAIQAGFKYAVLYNYDFVVQYDGDGQHIAEEINTILNPLLEKKANVIIGSRFLNPGKKYAGNILRKLGIKYFKYLIYLLTGIVITDSTSGFRAYDKKVLSFLSENYPSDYPEPEAIILFHKKKFNIKEVSVEMRLRTKGKSSISGLLTLYYILKVSVSIIMSNFKKY